jgi:hypothetical protein
MNISEAQKEMRIRFAGGFYGQLVLGLLWLASASLATSRGSQAGMTTLIVGSVLIFSITELLVRVGGVKGWISAENSLRELAMQIAFVLPLSMSLLIPVSLYRLNWFYPAMMVLLGAHYLPFVFLYGMRIFAALAALLVGGGVLIALYWPDSFNVGAWYTGLTLLVFSIVGRRIALREIDAKKGKKFEYMSQNNAPDLSSV